jgi:hypothetical protein
MHDIGDNNSERILKGDRPEYQLVILLFVHYLLIIDEVLDLESVRKYFIQLMF